jgi:Helix-turn-helix of DDE superfamily endonuclease
MHWLQIQTLDDAKFQRYTGVKKPTFSKMVEVIKNYELEHKNKFSKPFKYSAEDRLLIMLDYYREYPTFFHLGIKYKIHESTAYRIVTKIEEILIQSGKFSLPKKREIQDNTEIQVVVIDASEQEIERPKKNKN